jgi:hypothetical protein
VTGARQTKPSVAEHPRARRAIARAKGFGGLAGLVATLFFAQRAGVPAQSAVVRGLVGGVVAYVGAWAAAVYLWRHLIVAEFKAAAQSER